MEMFLLLTSLEHTSASHNLLAFVQCRICQLAAARVEHLKGPLLIARSSFFELQKQKKETLNDIGVGKW